MITDSQRKTLNFITAYVEKNGFSPTFPEIARGIGIQSQGTAHRYVKALIEQGYLTNDSGRRRGLRLVNQQSEYTLPLLGKIAAGHPIEAIPDQQEINLLDFFMGPGRFALKVQGDSMIDAGILDGDIAIIRQQNHANNGDIVVALIDNEEATLKTIEKLPAGQIKLIPANQNMRPMIYTATRVQVQGVLVGSMRRY